MPDNVVQGTGALPNQATVSFNVALGAYALRDYHDNEATAVGEACLVRATGIRNVAVGAYSGSAVTTGTMNTFLGYAAGGNSQSPTVSNSIAIGANAITTESNQITLGNASNDEVRVFEVSMLKAKPSLATYFFGPAGNKTATGTSCLGIGQGALASLTTGGNNIAIGYLALNDAQTPGSVVAIGSLAARYGTGMTDCVAIGTEAFGTATSGVGGTAIGHFSLQHALAANNNTGCGDSTLRFTTTGEQNVAVGYVCADQNLTGSFNVYVGAGAALARTEGDNNVIVGYRAGADAVIAGNANVAVGRTALLKYEGDNAVAVGYAALGTATGADNTALGYEAGGQITTGVRNTFLGFASGESASQKADAANSTAIGADTFTTADNQVVIGNSDVDTFVLGGVTVTKAQLLALLALV